MQPEPEKPTSPTSSAGLSLLELRRHLLRRAGELSARARGLREKGDTASALRAAQQSHRLRDVAHTMGQRRDS